MNEIEIKKYELPKIEIKDYDLIKKAIEEDNQKYSGYVVTTETLDTDVKKRAELRKQAKVIDDKRKEIEKEISEPIKKFKADCDCLKKMYEESADMIDKQIKVFELQEKENKKNQIEIIFNKLVTENSLNNLLNLNMLFDERYLNKTFKLEEIEKELLQKINEIVNDLKAIKELNSEYEVSLINDYLKTFSLSTVIVENTRLQELKEKTKTVEEKKEVLRQEKIEEILNKPVETEEIDPLKTYTLKITAELSKQKKLKEFLELNNMKFERID